MGNNRFVIVAAIALLGFGCATSSNRPAGPSAAPGTEEVRFMGHRLLVHLDAAGKPASAQAWDPNDKEVPTAIVGLGDVNVCAPKPVGPSAGSAPQCEPFSVLPDKISFKTGANSICWYVSNGRIIYYPC